MRAYTLECPNCNGVGLWLRQNGYWRCKSCKGMWCEINVYRLLQPGAHLVGACFIPTDTMFDWYRGLAVEEIRPGFGP